MRYFIFFLFLFLGLFLKAQETPIFHDLNVTLNPGNSSIKVTDEITFRDAGIEPVFSLNKELKITEVSPNITIEIIAQDIKASDFGMDRDDAGTDASKLQVQKYRILFKQGKLGDEPISISFMGKIESPIEQSEENYQRGFSESPGIISDIGIYLAGSTYWIPHFGDKMVSFQLTTVLPEGWKTVSQGARTFEKTEDGVHIDTWVEKTPQEEIFLIGARFSEYSFDAGKVDAMAFLRTPDEALANKYLETTAQYLEMYRNLIGPFPYSKFALVENFWETGYGMPSFTLLGEKIIRFPFILHSSYPHELLHNWWGNSVYVDFESGNWCEGLTAYMADHLIKEQRGQGDEYRRTTLQKFADYVTPENDFPVNAFLSRHNAPSEAVGYGKVSMIFHMLRRDLGEDVFKQAIQRFNRENAFKVSSWLDIQRAFESVSGKELNAFFTQWLQRPGAPELSLKNVRFDQDKLSFTIEQLQDEDVFEMNVPVIIQTDKNRELISLRLTGKKQEFQHSVPGERIVGVQVDPMYDVFRVLHPDEVPASLSKAYGAKKTTFILPSNADKRDIDLYKSFIDQWKEGNSGQFELLFDNELDDLPVDHTSWILGYQNKFADPFFSRLERYGVQNKMKSIEIGTSSISKVANSAIITAKHPENLDAVLVYFSINQKDAVTGLVRKLPHYGKYSYLAFEGTEPTNIVKGQWDVLDSPLVRKKKEWSGADGTGMDPVNGETKSFFDRYPLAVLAPVFSSGRIMKDIEFLASTELKGRGLGTPELDKAASYIADEFKNIGLIGGEIKDDYVSFYQSWEQEVKGKGTLKLTNVIGAIGGVNEKLSSEPIVISAHYDHLGLGWPDVHSGDEGKIHYGADDNASGVAILLELARNLKKNLNNQRPVIFVAFTGEEAGLLGSRHFVREMEKIGVKPFANLNLDTNGRLFDQPLLVLNGNTAREWKFIFMGTEYVTGVKTELVQQQIDASDQVAFNEAGIPAVQLFSGANTDYHRPGDVIEKLDPNGMVKIATVAKEVIQYLADRTDPMPYTGESKATTQEQNDVQPKKERKASTGSMPDFAFSGEGVRIAAISEGSGAEKAGLLKGDIIIGFNGVGVRNLADYSNELKKYQPGEKVNLMILRGDEKLEKELVLGAR